MSGRFGPVPGVMMTTSSAASNGSSASDLMRRIDCMTRFRSAMASGVTPDRDREFWHVIANARVAAQGGRAEPMAAAVFALDLLSLELCEE